MILKIENINYKIKETDWKIVGIAIDILDILENILLLHYSKFYIAK